MKDSLDILTKSAEETKKLGEKLAKEILSDKISKKALVISLEGDLGAGKTTFTQGFAKGLGIKENPRSPTFVIMRTYLITPPNPPLVKGRSSEIPSFTRRGKGWYSNFIHIDAYRIASKDMKTLGWNEFSKNTGNIILIEWGNRIKNILPKNSLIISFGHLSDRNKRIINIKQ